MKTNKFNEPTKGWRKAVQERIQAEIMSLHLDWLNEKHYSHRKWVAEHPKRFLGQVEAAVRDPQFLINISVSEMLKRVWMEKREMPNKTDASVEILDLPVRALHVMECANIKTVGQLCEKTAEELLAYKNFGQEMLDEVNDSLQSIGLKLKEIKP